MKRSFIFVVMGLFLQILISFSSNANLLISPTRVEFGDRQRVAKVVLVNNGNEYSTYRIEWKEKTAQGENNTLTDSVDPQGVNQMIRMSPTQVRLAPGERQIVKLALRKPRGLVDDEYRSRLLFRALPNDTEGKDDTKIGIGINIILSYSIPVILRQGELINPKVGIKDIKLVKNEANEVDSVKLLFSRSGKYSSFGNVEMYFLAKSDNKETKVSILNGVSIYPEVNEQNFHIDLLKSGMIKPPGTLRVTYKGKNKYKNHTFIDEVFDIDENGFATAVLN